MRPRIGSAVVAAYRRAFSGLPRPVWLLALANLVNRSGTMVVPFLTLYVTHRLGYPPSRAGQLLSLYGVGAMLGSWLGGWLGDRIGPIRIQQLSFLATGAGFIVLAQLRSYAALAVAVPVVSCLGEAFRPALLAAVAEHSGPPVRARSFVLIRLTSNLGMAIGPALGGLLAAHNYAWLFWGDALTCWAAAGLLAAIFGTSPKVSGAPAGSPEPPARGPWRDLPFVAFFGLTVVLGMVFLQLWSTYPLYLKERFLYSERAIGALFALNPVVIVLFEMVLVKSLENRRPLRVIGLGVLLVGVGFGLLPLGPAVLVPIVSMLVVTVGEMLTFPMSNAVVGRRAPAASTGRYMGAYALSFAVAFCLSPAAGTALYERLGPDALWFGIALTCGLVGAGFVALGPRLGD